MPGGGGDARMLMTLGYDPDQQAFVGTWVGSMMTHLWVYRGALDADQKVLTLETEGPSFKNDGATVRYRDVITLVSANERTLTSFGQQPDGSWKQFMQAKYTRTPEPLRGFPGGGRTRWAGGASSTGALAWHSASRQRNARDTLCCPSLLISAVP